MRKSRELCHLRFRRASHPHAPKIGGFDLNRLILLKAMATVRVHSGLASDELRQFLTEETVNVIIIADSPAKTGDFFQ
jgi:hypothetical protein